MAQQTVVVMTCDVCGSEGAATHEVIVDGKWCELEACDGCWSSVSDAVQPLYQAGRTRRKRKLAVAKA